SSSPRLRYARRRRPGPTPPTPRPNLRARRPLTRLAAHACSTALARRAEPAGADRLRSPTAAEPDLLPGVRHGPQPSPARSPTQGGELAVHPPPAAHASNETRAHPCRSRTKPG